VQRSSWWGCYYFFVTLLYEFYLEEELDGDYIETIGKDVDDDAKAKIKRWKRALTTGSSDPLFDDINAMKTLGLTWHELMDLPERVYLSMRRINTLRMKEERKQKAMGKYGIEW